MTDLGASFIAFAEARPNIYPKIPVPWGTFLGMSRTIIVVTSLRVWKAADAKNINARITTRSCPSVVIRCNNIRSSWLVDCHDTKHVVYWAFLFAQHPDHKLFGLDT